MNNDDRERASPVFYAPPAHLKGWPQQIHFGDIGVSSSSVSTLDPSTGVSHCQGDGGGTDLSMIIMTYISRQNSIFL